MKAPAAAEGPAFGGLAYVMRPDAMDWTLSDNHRRGIASTLWLLDEMLCRFEGWAKGQTAAGVLYRERDTLSASQRRAILREVAALRRLMDELRRSLGLAGKTQETASGIWSLSSACTEAVAELESKHLRRYGAVPKGFGAEFDPKVEQLLAGLIRITRAASRAGPDEP